MAGGSRMNDLSTREVTKLERVHKLIAGIFFWLTIVGFVPSVWAQQSDTPEFKMPCSEVLKLKLDKFTDIYGEKTQDYSTYGMKQAFAYYVDCKRPANDAQARLLGKAKSKLVDQVRDELSKIGNAAWEMTYISAGGGTMYGLMSVGAYGSREEFMASFISAMANERPLHAARRHANASIAKARKLLRSWSRMPKIEVYGDQSLAVTKQNYRELMKDLQAAANRLLAMIEGMKDVAAERAAARLVDEMETAVD